MFRSSMRKFAERWFGVKNQHQALLLKRKLSLLYAFLGWNAFGIGFVIIMRNKLPEDAMERRKSYANLTGSPGNLKVYQVTGLTVTREFELLKEAREKKEVAENEN